MQSITVTSIIKMGNLGESVKIHGMGELSQASYPSCLNVQGSFFFAMQSTVRSPIYRRFWSKFDPFLIENRPFSR
jgi:hypothetical protein